MKILLVDDDAFLSDMYATKFSESGHTVESVSSASAALAKLEDGQYDGVLLDIVMPGMTGLQLLEEINKSGKKGKTKFIVLSNQSEVSDRAAAKETGADGYIIKAESVPSDVVKKAMAIIEG